MNKKLLKALGCILATTVVATSFAACAPESPEDPAPPAKRTHDQITHVVTGSETGETRHHNFVDGKCTMCDETTIFRQDAMYKSPEILLTEQPEEDQGTIEWFWYKTRAYGVEEFAKDGVGKNGKEFVSANGKEYNGEELWIWKRAYVYLPAGYDPDDTTKKYNVMYMMHGDKLNEGYWFAKSAYEMEQNKSAYTNGYGTENMLDYMHANGLAEDTIYLGITMYQYYTGEPKTEEERDDNSTLVGGNDIQGNYYSGYIDAEDRVDFDFGIGENGEGKDAVIWKEWKYHLMPYVVAHYNTYAEVPEGFELPVDGLTEENADFFKACEEARDHVAYTGLSRGGGSVRSIMTNALEYCSYFAYESTGVPDQATIDNINAKKDTYPTRYIFISSGSMEGPEKTDASMLEVRDALGWTQNEGSDIAGGDRICYLQVNGTAHNYATWITNLYNFSLVAFKGPTD